MGYFSHSSVLKLVYFAVIFVVIVKGFASLRNAALTDARIT